MKDVKAKDIMTSPVISAKKSASSREIAVQLVSGLFSGMPVTDDERRVIGVITEHDLLDKIREGKDLLQLTVEDVMQKNPITADVNTPLRDVLDIMIENSILRIPITEALRLVGIISRSDILKIALKQTM